MNVSFGEYVFDRARRRLTRGQRPVGLTPKAFALLETLVDANPAAVSKEQLYETLWPGLFVEMGNLYTLVAEIRNAAGDDALIRTVHRFGYALGVDTAPIPGVAAYLLVAGRAVALNRGENLIGRDLLHNPDVSRRHASVVVSGESATVHDLGSKNGTWVNGRCISSPAVVTSGDSITFGLTRTTLALALDSATVTADQPE